jgi:hypothetical protein
MHAEEADQSNIDNKQCPGEKARPAEKKVDDLCLAYQRMRPWDNGKYGIRTNMVANNILDCQA